jgi:hypothetical protein
MARNATMALLVLLLALAGCGEEVAFSPGATPPPDGAAPAPASEPAPNAIWFEVLGVSQQGRDLGEIDLAVDADALAPLWERHGFEGSPPEVGFDEQAVLVLVRAEDACPDDLVEARLVDGVLETTWLPPAGGCNQPLIPTAYAIALHRADLPTSFEVVLREHEGHGGDKRTTFALPPYDGPPAPAPSPPPQQMDEAALDEVFAGHPLHRCGEVDDFRTEPTVDGPLSEDPEVAAAQRGRAEYGFPSDEATVRALLTDPDDPEMDRAFGFPLTATEVESLWARNRMDVVDALEPYRTEHADTFGFLLIDQPGGGVLVVGVTDDLEEHEARLTERFPGAPLRVVRAPASQSEIEAGQERLMALMGGRDGPRVTGSGAGGPWLTVMVIDPTRELLDDIAELVDPAWTCIDVELTGLPPATTEAGP